MKTIRSSRLLRTALVASSLFLTGLSARAITVSALLNVSTVNPFHGDTVFPFSDDGTPLGSLDFTGQPVLSMPALQSMNFSLALGGLDTGAGNFDVNNITLTIAGFDTGIKLNGYTNSIFSQTRSFTGNVLNGASILAAIQATPGSVTVGMLDITPDGSNEYFTYGGSFLMTFNSEAVPFTPSENMGLLVMGAASVWVRLRRRSVPSPAVA
jgi:hypothetical protein